MDRDALSQRLMKLFLAELEEHEQTLERDTLALERAAPEAHPELVERMFRAAHSLKGAARAVHAQSIEAVCHRMEHRLSELRRSQQPVPPALVQDLLAQLDKIREAAAQLRKHASTTQAAAPTASSAPLASAPAQVPPPALPPVPSSPAQPRGPEPSSLHKPQPPMTSEPASEPFARVDVAKLDSLSAHSRELLIASSRLDTHARDAAALHERAQQLVYDLRNGADAVGAVAELARSLEQLQGGLRHDAGRVTNATRRVDDQVRRLRMVPLREACSGLERVVRDLARDLDKQARLVLPPLELEIDRDIVQRLRDPLLHLVRNAVSHGVESPAARRAAGKPPEATLRIDGTLRGALIDLHVTDDGGGLDLEAIRARARALGLPEAADEDELATYVFAPGLSTAAALSEISGRGVGLDAVKRTIEALHGSVSVRTQRARGTRFTLSLPLTLSKLRCLLLMVRDRPYALPTSHAVRVLRFRADQLLKVGTRELVRSESELVPTLSLGALLGFPVRPAPRKEYAQALVVASGGRSVALSVEELVDERELVIHKLPARVARAHYVSGATLLSGGRVAPVLHGSELAEAALSNVPRGASSIFKGEQRQKRLLVADDSLTTRALIKSILEDAGYLVEAARDGGEALRMLSEQPYDLVVSDVQMPNMDGFELTAAMRRAPALAQVPVVLVTALESDRDRVRGLEAGANAYLGKSAFDHRVLLEVVGGLL